MTDNSYIKKRADKFNRLYISRQISEHSKVIDAAKTEIYDIDDDLDKVTFLRMVLEENAKQYTTHLITCTNKIDCPVNYNHESVTYYLTQELNRLGIRTNNDQFTIEEKADTESKLDQILADLQTLKDGHKIIHEDFKAEMDELRELFILGKKHWFQVLIGKTTEMVAGGIISSTISEKIVSDIQKEVTKLLP